MSTHFKSRTLLSVAIGLQTLGLALFSASCGRQAYQVVSTSEQQAAPGNFTVPPKVDIILAEDNDGAMAQSYAQVAAQFPAFLTALQSSGWDYHFAGIPLATDEAITQAYASTYDSNWGSQWVAPYPGAQQWITGPNGTQIAPPGNLSASVFTIPTAGSNYGLIPPSQVSNSGGGLEQGFQTIWDALSTRVQGTGIVRSDALLVVMTLAVNDDTSLVNECIMDGIYVNCEAAGVSPCTSGTAQSNYVAGYHAAGPDGNYDGVCGTLQQSQDYYQSLFEGYKSAPSQFKFYASVAAAHHVGSSCIGTNSFTGQRYMNMAALTGGVSIDICSTDFSSQLATLSSQLQALKLGYHTDYLFISQVPQVPTIVVTKYPGGNTSNPVVIPQDPNNGWEYAGSVSDVYTINYPVPMDQASGIAIHLNGNSVLVGNDTASVTYTPAGASNSVTN